MAITTIGSYIGDGVVPRSLPSQRWFSLLEHGPRHKGVSERECSRTRGNLWLEQGVRTWTGLLLYMAINEAIDANAM